MERGVVERVSGNSAYVTMKLAGGCKNCVNKALCFAGDKPIPLKIDNRINLKVGDIVQFDIKPGKKIFSSFILFIIPIVNLILGYYLGAHFGGEELYGILGALGGLLFSGGELILINKIVERNQSMVPQNIIKVDPSMGENLGCDRE